MASSSHGPFWRDRAVMTGRGCEAVDARVLRFRGQAPTPLEDEGNRGRDDERNLRLEYADREGGGAVEGEPEQAHRGEHDRDDQESSEPGEQATLRDHAPQQDDRERERKPAEPDARDRHAGWRAERDLVD